VFDCRGRDHEIRTVAAKSRTQNAPTPRRSQVEWHNPVAIKGQDPVQPVRKSAREAGIGSALSSNAALYFTNADNAKKEVGPPLLFESLHDHPITLPLAQLG
jgi:hypothetical protein